MRAVRMTRGGLISTATAALVATVAGVGGTLPVVLAAERREAAATPRMVGRRRARMGRAANLESVQALALALRSPPLLAVDIFPVPLG